MKRLIDIILSSMALILLSPLFAVVAILIKVDSAGPIFYRGIRIGRYGKPFRIYKFRTMVANAEKLGGPSTAADDPRLTKIGKNLIKRFNLDELPQFINVLKGEMSIVGPRPEVPDVIALYSEDERTKVLSIRPGITDWATLWIRDEGERLEGSPDPHKTYLKEIWPEKRRLQMQYVKNHSIYADIKIMFATLKVHLLDRLIS
jgi:lipopolysaccharide/colanic/teichoic acid biosynthesis glycosyltransferase